jgi:hypothetical protein
LDVVPTAAISAGSGSDRSNGGVSRPSITLKPDDVRRALECQVPPRKKDMTLLCEFDDYL